MIDVDVIDNIGYHKSGKPKSIELTKKYWLFDRRLKLRVFKQTYHANNTFEETPRSGFTQ